MDKDDYCNYLREQEAFEGFDGPQDDEAEMASRCPAMTDNDVDALAANHGAF